MCASSVPPSAEIIIEATRNWLEKAVIGLNLCPFAKAVYGKGQIRYRVSEAITPDALMAELEQELQTLATAPPEEIDTTLLIHPQVLGDFHDFNDFLFEANDTLVALGLEGDIQIASFHPRYQFAETEADAIENYTNRSPFPILHLLREASVDRAVAAFPEAEAIYLKNIATMEALGTEGWQQIFGEA